MSDQAIKVLSTTEIREDAKGMILSGPTKAGSRRVALVRQKDFVKAYLDTHPTDAEGKPTSRNFAKKAFEAYRIETATDFTKRLGARMMSGETLAQGASINKSGAVTSIRLMTNRDTTKANVSKAIKTLSEAPVSIAALEDLLKKAKERALEAGAIDAATSEPAPQGQAQPVHAEGAAA